MSDYRHRFLDLALEAQALKFGEFVLKSGRKSPYFFNAGQFFRSDQLTTLAACYAERLQETQITFDVIFGPAYKGIPLATAIACEYARRGHQVSLAYDRKEQKTHGEGGMFVGAPLHGKRVMVIDDVITAGTAIRSALPGIRAQGGTVVGVGVALDRQEIIQQGDARTALDALSAEIDAPIVAIVDITTILTFIKNHPSLAHYRTSLEAYQAHYCIHHHPPK